MARSMVSPGSSGLSIPWPLAWPSPRSRSLAEQDGRVVGYAASAIERERAPSHGPSEIGVVSYNGVAPDCRGQGIGTALIERVVDYLRAEGARVLVVSTLESDEPACHIYEKLGFEEYVRLVHYSLEEPKRES